MTFATFLNNLIDDAHERGRNWARTCAALTLSSENREFLENDAKAMARRLPATPFNPNANPEDRLRADEHQKTLHDLDDGEMALTHALVSVKQREDELAHLGREAPAPKPSTWLTIGGITLFAAGFALGIYDWVRDRLSDPYLAALVALVPSAALGIFVVRCLTHPDSPQKRLVGLIAGIGLSIATGVLRYAFAPDEWIVAGALTLLESFVVCFLDWQGKHLQARHQTWLIAHEARAKAEEQLSAARQHHVRAVERVAQLKQQVSKHLEEVTLRSLTFQKLPEIEPALLNAIVAGAHKGIAENQGLKRGVIPSPTNSNPTRAVLS